MQCSFTIYLFCRAKDCQGWEVATIFYSTAAGKQSALNSQGGNRCSTGQLHFSMKDNDRIGNDGKSSCEKFICNCCSCRIPKKRESWLKAVSAHWFVCLFVCLLTSCVIVFSVTDNFLICFFFLFASTSIIDTSIAVHKSRKPKGVPNSIHR